MNLKKYTAFFLLISCNIFSQEYWIEQNSPVNKWLTKCVFTDTLNGWVCGDSGVIIHTSNGGLNWVEQITNVDFPIQDISFVNERLGWGITQDLVHYRNYVMKTNDGGSNWNLIQYPDTTFILQTIYFLDSLNGYIGGYGGIILKTTNAGGKWDLISVDTSQYYTYHIAGFSFFNNKFGVAYGGVLDFGGVLWKTTNYGLNWNAFLLAPEPVFDVLYIDSANAYAACGEFDLGAGFISTNNNWLNFNYKLLIMFGEARSIALRTQNEIWIPLSFSHRWAVTTDTGENWLIIVNPDSNSVYDALFIDSTHGWAVGYYGKIYKYNSQIIGISYNGGKIPSYFTLYQNYPNPFNPKTTINYELRVTGYVIINVYDISGKHVCELVNKKQTAGKYEVDFSGEGLASGVYFYKLEAEGFSDCKKMVLVK